MQTAIYNTANQTLIAGSDDELTSDITISLVQWDDRVEKFVLNNSNTAGSLVAFWETNTAQSIYLIFDDGVVHEITNADFFAARELWARWDID